MRSGVALVLAVCFLILLVPPPPVHADIINYKAVKPLPVLFVHGYNDKGESWEQSEFYNYVQTLGAKVISLDYSEYNRNDITSTAVQNRFAEALEKLPDGKFDIVAHSMGGLLTRYYLLQNEELRSRVRRVIMIGTPNHGSPVAFLNRVQDMIDDPSDYWIGGSKNEDVRKYRSYYEQYADEMFDRYIGGQIPKQPYEYWLSEHKDKPVEQLRSDELAEAGNADFLKSVGTNVLPGGLDYRYSRAFDDYAKLAAARSYYLDDRARLLGASGLVFDDVDGSHLAQRGKLDEATALKETKWCNFWFTDCQKASAKNIVMDRLMMERFDFLYQVDEDGRMKSQQFVANLFLHRLEQEESQYRSKALSSNRYVPQYITIATVDDPWHAMGRLAVDPFIINQSSWKYEEHDSVVPISSVTLGGGLDKNARLLDRNVKDIPDPGKLKEDTGLLQVNRTGYVAHGSQMQATELLRREYDNPLTGIDDQSILVKLDGSEQTSSQGNLFVVQPTNVSWGQSYRIEIRSPKPLSVKVAQRDEYQTWDVMETVALARGEQDFVGEYNLKPESKISDYLIVSPDPVSIRIVREAEEDAEGGEPFTGNYPYYLQALDCRLENGRIQQTFRIVDRITDQALPGLSGQDFVFRLDGKPIADAKLTVDNQTIRSASSILMALDYSSSMNGRPKLLSMNGAERFILHLEGKTTAQVGVLGFTENVKVLSGLTDNYKAASRTVFTDLTGGTGLYDAIVSGSAMLSAEKGRKTLFLMTDGEDSGSGATMEQAIQAAKDADAAIYILALGQANMGVLQKLAAETSGKAAYSYSAEELSELYQIMTEQRDYIYTLTYSAPDLDQAHLLAMRMTGNRSNSSETAYGPLVPDSLRSWWTKGVQLWEDLKEAYKP
ncbi:alpha/beta fold hydrolase [Paenibacillus sp. D51F]